MKGFRAAAAFLTRMPMGAAAAGPPEIASSAPFFPIVGGLVGLVVAGLDIAARTILPSLVAAGLAIGAGVVLTGGLHEDGLGDMADALGGWSREEALRILKDPAHGTYGVLAISFGLLLRVGALAALDGWSALAVLPAAHALSRGAAIALVGTTRPAVVEGLGASYARQVSTRVAVIAIVTAIALGLGFLGLWAVPAGLLVIGGDWSVGRLALRKLGGITGDALGASQQVAEALVLLLGAAVVTRGWPGLPWWR